jgi:hypothetical protein
VNTLHLRTPIRPCGNYRIIKFLKLIIKPSFYDYKNKYGVDFATHSREKCKRGKNEEEKEAQKQLN